MAEKPYHGPPEPTREQVLDWLRRHPGQKQLACIRALWPPLSAPDHERVYRRISSWIVRAKDTTPKRRYRRKVPPQQPAPLAATPTVAELPDGPRSEQGRVEFYQAQLDVLLRASRNAAERQDWRVVGTLNAQIAAARKDLDDARAAEASKGATLDRSPKSVAVAILSDLPILLQIADAGEGERFDTTAIEKALEVCRRRAAGGP